MKPTVKPWNFFIPRHPEITKNDWEKVFIPKKREKIKEETKKGWNPYGLTYEFNLLHVGLTRARFCLFVYDDQEYQNITLPLLGEEVEKRVTRGDVNVFTTNWKTPRPSGEDLYNAGQRLLERDTEQAQRFFKLASKAFAELDNFRKAAECQEKAEDYDAAAELYKTSNDKENEIRVLAVKYRKLNDNNKSGELFTRLGELQITIGKIDDASFNFENAKESFYKANKIGLAAESAYKSADCLPQDKHLDRAIRFLNAVEYYNKDKNYEYAIRSIEKSITEAKEAQLAGTNSIQGLPIDAWKSQRYLEIAEIEKNQDKISEGAAAANKAANLIKELISSENFKILPNKEKYEKFRTEALSLSIELYIKSNQIIKAIDSQKELLGIISPKESVVVIRDRWKFFASLYMDQQEYDQYAITILELTEVLTIRRHFGYALVDLNEGIDKIQAVDIVPRKPLLTLTDELIRIAKVNNEWDDVAHGHEIYANIYEKEFNFVESWMHFKELGKALIMAGRIVADKHFKHGIKLLSKTATSSEVGKNCFFEIVLDGYAKNPDLYDYALSWLKEASVYFAQDFDLSISLLNSYLKTNIQEELDRYSKKLKETKDPKIKEQLEENIIKICDLQAWVITCIGFVHHEYANISGKESEKKKARDFINKGLSLFEKANNSKMLDLIKKNL